MENLDFRGTGQLLRFYLRRGWITRAFWLLTPAMLVMSAVSSYGSMFASQQELSAFVDESIFQCSMHPDLPFKLYAAGQLNIIAPSWARSYQIVAYRNVVGKPLSAE